MASDFALTFSGDSGGRRDSGPVDRRPFLSTPPAGSREVLRRAPARGRTPDRPLAGANLSVPRVDQEYFQPESCYLPQSHIARIVI